MLQSQFPVSVGFSSLHPYIELIFFGFYLFIFIDSNANLEHPPIFYIGVAAYDFMILDVLGHYFMWSTDLKELSLYYKWNIARRLFYVSAFF